MNPLHAWLENLQQFISPDPETGKTTKARILHVGGKVVALVGILIFLIGVALLFNTVQDEDTIQTTGIIKQVESIPRSDAQHIVIEYTVGNNHYTQIDTSSAFKSLNHAVGDQVELLVDTEAQQAILVEAIPALRFSFMKTSGVGIVLILIALWMRRRSQQ